MICTFARLDSQIPMFKDTSPDRCTSQEWKSVTPDLLQMLPPVFDSVKQARQYWDLIVEADMLWRVSHPSGFSTLDFGEKNIRESLGKPSALSHKIHQELHSYTTLKEGSFHSLQPVFERSRRRERYKRVPWRQHPHDQVPLFALRFSSAA